MIEIDISADIEEAEKQLTKYERVIIPRAISSAINKTKRNLVTKVNQTLSRRTGLLIREIKGAEWEINSSPKTLWSSVTMRRRAFNLRRFVKPGKLAVGAFRKQKGVSANPWRRQRIFDGAFIIRGKTHGKLIVVARTSENRYPLKGLYGPSLHIEFNRPSMRRLMRVVVAQRFRINFERDLNFHVGRFK